MYSALLRPDDNDVTIHHVHQACWACFVARAILAKFGLRAGNVKISMQNEE
jgi:hypothetical protein